MNRPIVTDCLAPWQATACQGCTPNELARLVSDAQTYGRWQTELFRPGQSTLHEWWMVGRELTYLIEITDIPMQHALDVSVAESMPPGPASTDNIFLRASVPRKRYRCLRFPLSLAPRPRLKHAPPDLMSAGAVTVSFVKAADTESARRFLDAVTLLRQWGRESLTNVEPDALEAIAS